MSRENCCHCDDDERCWCCQRFNKLKCSNAELALALAMCASYKCLNDEYTDGRNCRSCPVCIAKNTLEYYNKAVIK